MSANRPDPWIDDRLRQVPLPAGLLARLRQGTLPDKKLDETLQVVELPAGLRDSLLGIPADMELDRRLRAVACPQPLKARLKETVANEQLDEQLRDVPYPVWLAASMRAVWRVPRENRYAQWAQALALLLLVGLSYSLGMAAILHETYQDSTRASLLAANRSARFIELEPASDEANLIAFQSPLVNDDEPNEVLPLVLSESDLAAGEPLLSGTVDQVLYDAAHLRVLNQNIVSLLQGEVLGQPRREDDQLPELVVVKQPAPRGIQAPLFRGFDRRLLLLERVQPIVALNENSALNTSAPPLWTNPEGYQRATSEIRSGTRPAAESIHPEDFLAAGNYEFIQPAAGELALRTAAGPAVFGDGESSMLLVGIQAGEARQHRSEPTHLVVAVDTSRSMAWGDRLELTRQALRQLLTEMRPDDRLSLVGFSEEVEVLLDSTPPSEQELILSAIDRLELGEGTHVVAGLQQATSLAMGTPPEFDMALEVVLITDGLGDLPREIREVSTQMMSLAAQQGVRWTVLDLGRPGHASQNLQTLTAAAGGRLFRCSDAEEIGWRLIDTAAGGSTLVAQEARLSVDFNPQTVLRYRLIGHVPDGGGFQAAQPASLRGGEAAVALYEVWLKPGTDPRAATATVATATLRWKDAHTGDPRERKQEIGRVQVALSPESSALPLITAQVLAETAEILAQSPYVSSEERNFSQLLPFAQSVNSHLRTQPSYKRTLELIQAAAGLP